MSMDLIIGLAVSVPLSIVANILTPRVLRWWDRRKRTMSDRRMRQLQEDLARARRARAHPEIVFGRAMFIVLATTMLGAVSTICTSIGFGVMEWGGFRSTVVSALYVVQIAVALLTVRLCVGGINDIHNERRLEELEAEVAAFASKKAGADTQTT